MNSVGDEVTTLRVKAHDPQMQNATAKGPPDFLLLDVMKIRSKSTRNNLMNRTLSYGFIGEVK